MGLAAAPDVPGDRETEQACVKGQGLTFLSKQFRRVRKGLKLR